jgi:hypothetical protein
VTLGLHLDNVAGCCVVCSVESHVRRRHSDTIKANNILVAASLPAGCACLRGNSTAAAAYTNTCIFCMLLQVFEAYCLVVLRIAGPVHRAVPAGQLAAAGEAFWAAVVSPAAAGRRHLKEALAAAALLPQGRGLTQPTDGHLLLFDVVVPGVQQCWLMPVVWSVLSMSYVHSSMSYVYSRMYMCIAGCHMCIAGFAEELRMLQNACA